MARRKHYPDIIDRKYAEAPSIRNTEKQLRAADILEHEWNAEDGDDRATFSELADDHELSRSTFQKSWLHYFGPEDEEMSFAEIEDEYGSTDAYYELKEDSEDDPLSRAMMGDLEDADLDLVVRLIQKAYEQGRRDERLDAE